VGSKICIFIANFLLFPAVKEFGKSVQI